MGISLGAAGVVETSQEAEPVFEWGEGLGGFAEFELAILGIGREPAPFGDAVFGPGQRHAVGGVDGAEPARDLVANLVAHGLQNRQGQRNAAQPTQEGPPVQFARGDHFSLPFFRLPLNHYA